MRHAPIAGMKHKFHSSPQGLVRFTAGIVSKNIVVAKTEAVVAVLADNAKCLTRYAPIVRKQRKFLSSLAATNRSTASIALNSNAVKQ